MKLSKADQATLDAKRYAEREQLAYHFILSAMVNENLRMVGRFTHEGTSHSWKLAFTPRMRDAVILQETKTRGDAEVYVRCFYLDDVRQAYQDRSYDSKSDWFKLQQLFYYAVEMERIEHNAA